MQRVNFLIISTQTQKNPFPRLQLSQNVVHGKVSYVYLFTKTILPTLDFLDPSYAYSSFVGIFRCSIVHVPSLFPIFYAREREARRFCTFFAANYFSYAFSFSSLDLKSCRLSNFHCLFCEEQPDASLNIDAEQHIANLA